MKKEGYSYHHRGRQKSRNPESSCFMVKNLFAVRHDRLQLFVLAGGNTVFLLERPEEGGIVGKTDTFAYGVHRQSLKDQTLGGDQPALSNAAVKADAHFLAEGLGDGTFTDIEMS